MIWITVLAMSFVFFSLGMLVVTVKLLTIALSVALLVIACFAIAFIWRKFIAPMLSKQKIWKREQLSSKGEQPLNG